MYWKFFLEPAIKIYMGFYKQMREADINTVSLECVGEVVNYATKGFLGWNCHKKGKRSEW